jgi:hypothetical protein
MFANTHQCLQATKGQAARSVIGISLSVRTVNELEHRIAAVCDVLDSEVEEFGTHIIGREYVATLLTHPTPGNPLIPPTSSDAAHATPRDPLRAITTHSQSVLRANPHRTLAAHQHVATTPSCWEPSVIATALGPSAVVATSLPHEKSQRIAVGDSVGVHEVIDRVARLRQAMGDHLCGVGGRLVRFHGSKMLPESASVRTLTTSTAIDRVEPLTETMGGGIKGKTEIVLNGYCRPVLVDGERVLYVTPRSDARWQTYEIANPHQCCGGLH